jgi:hypothetical protein
MWYRVYADGSEIDIVNAYSAENVYTFFLKAVIILGRSKLVIDYSLLQKEIDLLESKEVFTNYTSLCNAVCIHDSSLQPNGCARTEKYRRLPLHPGQCYLAISQKKVTCKTVPGKKGRVAGVSVNRKSKAEKFAANPEIQKALIALEKDVPEAYKALFERAKAGSVKAFVQLKCYYCYGYTRVAKACECSNCPLFAMNLMMWPKRTKSDDFEYDPTTKMR